MNNSLEFRILVIKCVTNGINIENNGDIGNTHGSNGRQDIYMYIMPDKHNNTLKKTVKIPKE